MHPEHGLEEVQMRANDRAIRSAGLVDWFGPRIAWAISRTFGVLACCAGSAWAGDWDVDAAHGNDANGGTSPSDAWRTITHAIAATPAAPTGGTQTIHIAPGTYDSTLGEVFPIRPRDAFELVGDGGLQVTALNAGGSGTVVAAVVNKLGGSNYTGPLTVLRGLRLENADTGVHVFSESFTEYLRL
jgi:hypothetical protein